MCDTYENKLDTPVIDSAHQKMKHLSEVIHIPPPTSGIKCSIVFTDMDIDPKVNTYLNPLRTEKLPFDYELIFVKSTPCQINIPHPISTKAYIRIINIEPGLKLEKLCLETATKALGEYIIFTYSPISPENVGMMVQHIEKNGKNIEAPPDKNYIIVRKSAFIKAGSFCKLSQQQKQQQENLPVNKLINLLSESADSVFDIFLAANKYKDVLKNETKYLNLEAKDSPDLYKILFLKSIKEYFDSGLEFQSESQCISFYKNQGIVGQVPPLPWYIAIILSISHLDDNPCNIEYKPQELQQACAILVSVYNETRFTELCFKAVRKFTRFPYHLIAVNNSSIDMQHFKTNLLRDNLVDEWFESSCSTHWDGLQASLKKTKKFRYIATLDSDAIVIKPNWLTEFIGRLNYENAALIGPQTYPGASNIKGYAIHPSCMVIDSQLIGTKFQINFDSVYPFDTGHLLTWDCLFHELPIIKVSFEMDGNHASSSALINKSVRHFYYTSRIMNLADDDIIDGCSKVSTIRQKLDRAYNSPEFIEIRQFCAP
jgi:hypothetical protein